MSHLHLVYYDSDSDWLDPAHSWLDPASAKLSCFSCIHWNTRENYQIIVDLIIVDLIIVGVNRSPSSDDVRLTARLHGDDGVPSLAGPLPRGLGNTPLQ